MDRHGRRTVSTVVAAVVALLAAASPGAATHTSSPPTLSLSASCGPVQPSTTITVSGSNYSPRANGVQVSVDGEQLVFAPQTNGSFSTRITFATTANRYYTISTDDLAGHTAQDFYSAPCRSPAITVQPGCAPVGTPVQVSVSGSGWAPSDSIEVVFDVDGSPQKASTRTDASGNFVSGVVFTVAPEARTYRITASGGFGLNASTLFVAPCSTGTTTSTTTEPPPPPPDTTTTTTTAPSTPPRDTTTTVPTTTTTRANAPTTTFITIGPGTTTTTAPGATTTVPAVTTTTEVFEIKPDESVPPLVAVSPTTTTLPLSTPGAALVVVPPLGPPGFVTTARGSGFSPGPVSLRWAPGIGETEATAGEDGTFEARVLVFPRDRLGPRTLIASGGDAVATAPLLVVPSTVQPSAKVVTQITRLRRHVHR